MLTEVLLEKKKKEPNYAKYKPQVLTIKLVIKQCHDFTQWNTVGYRH